MQGAPGAAIDPTVLALLSIFGGALLTAAAGAWGAWRQSKREHTRWARERRYEAYLEYIKALRTFHLISADVMKLNTQIDALTADADGIKARMGELPDGSDSSDLMAEAKDLQERTQRVAKRQADTIATLKDQHQKIVDSVAAFKLLGPSDVATAAQDVGSGNGGSIGDHEIALGQLMEKMRAALGLTDYEGGAAKAKRGRRGRPPA